MSADPVTMADAAVPLDTQEQELVQLSVAEDLYNRLVYGDHEAGVKAVGRLMEASSAPLTWDQAAGWCAMRVVLDLAAYLIQTGMPGEVLDDAIASAHCDASRVETPIAQQAVRILAHLSAARMQSAAVAEAATAVKN